MPTHILLSLSELSCLLIGMRCAEYVENLMDTLSHPSIPDEDILCAFQTSHLDTK